MPESKNCWAIGHAITAHNLLNSFIKFLAQTRAVKTLLTVPKANKELISYIAKVFEVRKMDIEITAGLTSREKTVMISGCEDLRKVLDQQVKQKKLL